MARTTYQTFAPIARNFVGETWSALIDGKHDSKKLVTQEEAL
jgi:hypothetical protein